MECVESTAFYAVGGNGGRILIADFGVFECWSPQLIITFIHLNWFTYNRKTIDTHTRTEREVLIWKKNEQNAHHFTTKFLINYLCRNSQRCACREPHNTQTLSVAYHRMTSERYVNLVVTGRIEHGRRCILSDANEPAVCNVIMKAIRCETKWWIGDRLTNLSNKLNKIKWREQSLQCRPKNVN